MRSVKEVYIDDRTATDNRRPTDRPMTSHFKKFQRPYLCERSSDPLHVWF